MKRCILSALFFTAVLIFIFSGCTRTIIDRHPVYGDTTRSPDNFSCRINGSVYPRSSSNPVSPGVCQYQFRYSGASAWDFNISGDRQQLDCQTFSVSITLDSIQLQRGKSYQLGTHGLQKNYGTYYLADACSQEAVELYTKDNNPGYITITEFNPYDSIVSGSFFFSVVDDKGNKYQITDGAFHRHFTD
jgi:hypothetical protein